MKASHRLLRGELTALALSVHVHGWTHGNQMRVDYAMFVFCDILRDQREAA